MSLTDLMSSMGLSVWPQMALGLFLVAFGAIAIRVLRAPAAEMEYGSNLARSDSESLKGDAS